MKVSQYIPILNHRAACSIPANFFRVKWDWDLRDFCLVMDGISEIVPATSEDFRRFSEVFRMLPKTSEDVQANFDHFRSRRGCPKPFKRRQFKRVLISLGHAKSSLNALLEHFHGNWIEFSSFVRICESGVRNFPWYVRSMSSVCKCETHA